MFYSDTRFNLLAQEQGLGLPRTTSGATSPERAPSPACHTTVASFAIFALLASIQAMVSVSTVFTGRDLLSLTISACAPPVVIVDSAITICYPQVTPELTQLADNEEVFKFARSLVTASEGETG
jgi:hypothetical protein